MEKVDGALVSAAAKDIVASIGGELVAAKSALEGLIGDFTGNGPGVSYAGFAEAATIISQLDQAIIDNTRALEKYDPELPAKLDAGLKLPPPA